MGHECMSGTAHWVWVGRFDELAIIQLPDEATASAAAMAFRSGGALREVMYTRRLSRAQAIDSMTMAGQADYRPAA